MGSVHVPLLLAPEDNAFLQLLMRGVLRETALRSFGEGSSMKIACEFKTGLRVKLFP